MSNKDLFRPALLLTVPLLLAAGCFSATRAQRSAAAQKRTFMPAAAPTLRLAPAPRFAPVKIRSFRALPPFDARSFVVRRAGSEFAEDFYNAWIVPPQELLRVQTARYLEQTGLFGAVYDASSGTQPPLSIEGTASELYLDYTGVRPTAVVTLRLLVLDERAPAYTVLFSDEKTGRASFEAADPNGHALAFGLALTQALESLSQTLAAAAF